MKTLLLLTVDQCYAGSLLSPQPDGVIQPEFQDCLRAIGEWLSVNGESIHETTYGPVQGMASVRTTRKTRESSFTGSTGHRRRLMSTDCKPK